MFIKSYQQGSMFLAWIQCHKISRGNSLDQVYARNQHFCRSLWTLTLAGLPWSLGWKLQTTTQWMNIRPPLVQSQAKVYSTNQNKFFDRAQFWHFYHLNPPVDLPLCPSCTIPVEILPFLTWKSSDPVFVFSCLSSILSLHYPPSEL